eukprot:s1072_g9.t1
MTKAPTAPLALWKDVQLPPLVHPETLLAAARKCAAFGGDKELLDAATLAGLLIQADAIRAHQELAAAGIPPPGLEERHPPPPETAGPPAAPPPEPTVVNEEELSQQAKQAMAAAAATNLRLRKQVPPVQVMPEQPPAPPAVPQSLPNAQTMAPASLAAVLQNMAGVPQAMMGHGMGLQAQNPQMPNMLPPARDLVQQRLSMAPRPVQPPAPPEPAKKEEAAARPGERPKEEKPPAPPEEDSELIRCHLHRKPQLSCKICRRVYYSAVDPISQKKDGLDRSTHDDKKGSDRKPEDEAPGARMRGAEAFDITNKQTYNFNSMLRDQILKNTYFKTLVKIDTFEGIMDEMYQYVETAETYGGGSTTVPSSLFCCLYRLFTIGLSYDELNLLCESKDWPYIRCCGFLYIRFGCAPEKLWDFLGEYCVDDQEFEPSKSTPGFVVTIGEYVESLLLDERYYYSTLPRIPVGVKKKIEEKVAPLGQYRKRAAQNKDMLHAFKEAGTPVEACRDNGVWVVGQTLQVIESVPSRIAVRIRAVDGREEVYHLGRVILRDEPKKPPERARSRSRSPKREAGAGPRSGSPDLTRSRGQSLEEMLEELRTKQRERAVCSTGKDYARKPIGFMSGLAMKRDVGQASTRLREEETYAPRQVEHRKQMADESILGRPETERDREQQLLKQQLFEKYGNINPRTNAKEQQQPADMDIEDASVLRLG